MIPALADTAPHVIGLAGLAGSGKSAAAAILEAVGYKRMRFAGPLKAMLRTLLYEAGVCPADATRMIEGDLKDVPAAALLGRSPRHAMISLGTEWGRYQMDCNFWAHLTQARICAAVNAGQRVVIEDVRFENEAAAILVLPPPNVGMVWRMTGRALDVKFAHESEAPLPACLVNCEIDNAGDLATLRARLLGMVGADGGVSMKSTQ